MHHRRDHHHSRDPLLLRDPEDRRWVEPSHEDDRPTRVPDRVARHVEPAHVVERREDENPIGPPELELDDLGAHVRVAVAVRDPSPFGATRRAGGVEDALQVGVGQLGVRDPRTAVLGDQRSHIEPPVIHARCERETKRQRRTPLHQPGRHLGELGLACERRRPRMVEQPGELFLVEPVVERDHHRTELGNREREQKVLGRVERVQRHPVALRDAMRREPRGKRVDVRIELPVRPRTILVDERLPLAEPVTGPFENSAQIGGRLPTIHSSGSPRRGATAAPGGSRCPSCTRRAGARPDGTPREARALRTSHRPGGGECT